MQRFARSATVSASVIRIACAGDRIFTARSHNTLVRNLGIPAKANADSEGNANGIPGGRRTVVGA